MNNVSLTCAQANDTLDLLAADLASSVYQVVLRPTTSRGWLDLELDLWQAISNKLATLDTDGNW